MEHIKESDEDLSPEETSSFLGKSERKTETKAWLLTTFSTEDEARSMRCEPGKKFSEYMHKHDRWFGVRCMRPKKLTGVARIVWFCRLKDGAGKDQKPTIGPVLRGSMENARLEALQMRKDAHMRRDMGMGAVPTLGAAIESYIERGRKKRSEATTLLYEKAAKEFRPIWGTSCNKVSSERLQKLVKAIRERVHKRYLTFKNPTVEITGDATVREAMRLVRSVYKDMMEDGTIKYSPVAQLVRDGIFEQEETRIDAIAPDDLPTVFKWLEHRAHPAVRDYIYCAITLGFRKSLLGRLRWDRLDQKKMSYRVFRKDIGNKAKRDFEMPIPLGLWNKVFAPRLADPHKHPVWIIESPKKVGQPLTSIRGTLAKLNDDLEIGVTVHGLRRSAAGIMKAVAGELFTARLLTHRLDAKGAKSRNTDLYIVTTEKDLRQAMEEVWEYLEKAIQPKAPE